MAKVRPVVVNQDMVVLGGNMRLKAMKEAGWKEAPVEIVDWDEDKQRQFIIKDNDPKEKTLPWEVDARANAEELYLDYNRYARETGAAKKIIKIK